MVFIQVKNFESRRKELNIQQQKDVRTARMFLVVVVVVLLCNIFPAVHYSLLNGGNIYAETQFGSMLFFTFNSSINMPIYYLRDSSFRRETNALFAKCFGRSDLRLNSLYGTSEGENARRATLKA